MSHDLMIVAEEFLAQLLPPWAVSLIHDASLAIATFQSEHTLLHYFIVMCLGMMSPIAIAYLLAPAPPADSSSSGNASTKNHPTNIVVLHTYPRPGPEFGLPSLSPYITKLETFLRVTGTPYMVEYTLKHSSKGKMPYLTYNGIQVADSHFALKWLEEKGISEKLDADLDQTETGAVEAYRMLLVSLSDLLEIWRWTNPTNQSFIYKSIMAHAPALIRPFIVFFSSNCVQRNHWQYGLARHTREELLSLADDQLAALSSLLGPDDYMMGTDTATTLDCCAYGVLSQYVLSTLRRGGSQESNGLVSSTGSLLGLPDCDIARGVTWNLVRFVRRIGEKYFKEFAAAVSEQEWERLEAEAVAREEARGVVNPRTHMDGFEKGIEFVEETIVRTEGGDD